MATFNSITIDLSPITDQIDQLRAQLEATNTRLERAEDRIRDLERAQLDTAHTRAYQQDPPARPHSKKPRTTGLGRGLQKLMNTDQ